MIMAMKNKFYLKLANLGQNEIALNIILGYMYGKDQMGVKQGPTD